MADKIDKTNKKFQDNLNNKEKVYTLEKRKIIREANNLRLEMSHFLEYENAARNVIIQHYNDIKDIHASFIKNKEEEYKKIQVISSPVEKEKELDRWQESIKDFYDRLNEFDKKFRKKFVEEMMSKFF